MTIKRTRYTYAHDRQARKLRASASVGWFLHADPAAVLRLGVALLCQRHIDAFG